MKKSFWGFALFVLALLSCSSDEDSLQEIDQIMTFYMKDAAGKDLLHPTNVGSFSQVRMNDVFGENDNSPVSFSATGTLRHRSIRMFLRPMRCRFLP